MTESIVGALDRTFRAFNTLKQRSESLKTMISGDSVSALTLIQFHDELVRTWATNISVLDGRNDLNTLASAHLIDPPADFQQQFADVKTAGNAIVTYIETNLPAANGWLSVVNFSGTPSLQSWRTFTAAQLSSLDGLLDDLINAIG